MTTLTAVETKPSFANYMRDLWGRREFAWYLAIGSLRAQNSTTALGIFWYVLNPVIMSAIYFLVFGFIFAGSRKGDPAYLAYLVSGMFCFQFTRTTMLSGARSIIGNSNLISNLRFPRLVLPLSAVIEASIGFAVSMAMFFAIVLPVARISPGLGLLWFLPIYACQVIWNLGLGAISARITVPFRDFGNLLPFLTRLWFYLSPVLWTLDRLDGQETWTVVLVHLNPMFYFLSVYRTALLGEALVPWHLWTAAGIAVTTLAIGVALFIRFEGRITHHL